MEPTQRALVWIRFPFSDLERSKARPAMVVSHDRYNKAHEDVLICAVTSNRSPAPYKVPLSSEDLDEGDLPLDSMVRADKLVQVERGLIDRAFGRVDTETYDAVVEAIREIVERPS